MTPVTLETQIRAKVARELRAEIDNLFSAIRHRANVRDVRITVGSEGHKETYYGSTLLDSIKEAIYNKELVIRGDEAIKDFIRRIDDFDAQLAELRNDVNN